MSEKSTHNPKPKRKRHRSRNFPTCGLREAVDRAKVLRDRERANWTATSIAIGYWDFSPKSSGGQRTISTLIQYGLLEEEGKGTARRVRVSQLAATILESPNRKEKETAIQDAALKPALYRETWERYKDDLPSDDNLRWELTGKGEPFKGDLNEKSVDEFIESFRATLGFAGLIGNGTLRNEGDPAPDPVPETGNVEDRLQVGDYVQWTSQGIDQFEKPLRVRNLSQDGKFILVDSSQTGIPIEEVSKCDAPTGEKENGGSGRIQAVKRLPPKPGMNNEVFTLEESEAVLQWPRKLSPESFEDFEAWLKIILRKAKRASEKHSGDPNEGSTD